MEYPTQFEMIPWTKAPAATVVVPGSKSITNRALVLAALAGRAGTCTLTGALHSEDTEYMMQGLRTLGFAVTTRPHDHGIVVGGGQGLNKIPASTANLFVGNSGTTMRFLTALVSLGHGTYRLDGVPRMQERPIGDLLAALESLGAQAISEKNNGCPPIRVSARGLRGGQTRVRGDISSQFLSALLMVAPFATQEVVIEVEGKLVSLPYVAMTLEMMKQFNLQVVSRSEHRYEIPANQSACKQVYTIEPDASAASYFWGAAAITGGSVQVRGLNTNSLQGDVRLVNLLEEMGCEVIREKDSILVRGGELRGIDADMNDISDTVMTLAAVACFARGPTTIRQVAHIRHKETDRLTALANELRRLGAGVEEFADGLTIFPRPLQGTAIETYNDHRMAMSMALIGLKAPGVVIKNPGCVAKTYPGFFQDLEAIRC